MEFKDDRTHVGPIAEIFIEVHAKTPHLEDEKTKSPIAALTPPRQRTELASGCIPIYRSCSHSSPFLAAWNHKINTQGQPCNINRSSEFKGSSASSLCIKPYCPHHLYVSSRSVRFHLLTYDKIPPSIRVERWSVQFYLQTRPTPSKRSCVMNVTSSAPPTRPARPDRTAF